jgi:iron-sulfur cluster repair protein YtfE (RIC family)
LSDHALESRAGLPEAMRCLLAKRPRESWADPALPEMARFWLQMHDGFRGQTARMTDLVRQGEGDARAVHLPLIQTLGAFLQHLDGHHRIESGRYFPMFRRAEPRVAEGLDLLDRDHDAIHAHIEALHRTGLAYHQAVGSGSAARDELARFAEALSAASSPLTRHLDDEEEIVIPLIALYGASA